MRRGQLGVGEQLDRAGDQRREQPDRVPAPLDLGHDRDLLEVAPMREAELGIVPHGGRGVARECRSQMVEHADLAMPLDPLLDRRDQDLLVILAGDLANRRQADDRLR